MPRRETYNKCATVHGSLRLALLPHPDVKIHSCTRIQILLYISTLFEWSNNTHSCSAFRVSLLVDFTDL